MKLRSIVWRSTLWGSTLWVSTVSGHRFGIWICTYCALGVYTLGVYTLGVYSLGLPISDLVPHMPVLKKSYRGPLNVNVVYGIDKQTASISTDAAGVYPPA